MKRVLTTLTFASRSAPRKPPTSWTQRSQQVPFNTLVTAVQAADWSTR